MKKNLLILLVAIAGVFASCTRKDGVNPIKPNDGKEKSVYVKLTQAEGYAEGPSLPSGYTVNLSGGYVVFVDAYGMITNRIKVVGTVPGPNEVSISSLMAGAMLSNIRSTAYSVTVIGNLPAGVEVASSGPAAQAFGDGKLDLASQATLLNATLNGTGTITTAGNLHSALVSLTPQVSRIEIAGVTASSPISNFKLVGVFMDNFFSHYRLATGTHPDDLKQVTANVISGATPESFYTGFPSMCDFNANGLGNFDNNVVTPTSGNVWAYTLFPSVMPRIILRFKDITKNDITDAAAKYLTINGLKTTSGGTIYSLSKGVVYKISAADLVFSESDLSNAPVLAPKMVSVSITNIPWSVQDVKPSYGVKK